MISNPANLPDVIFSLVKKAFSFQNGALTIMATAPAFTVKQFFELILRDTDMRELILPLTLFAVMLMMYAIVAISDFYTGISASRKLHFDKTGSKVGFIESDKLWSSVWKSLGVLLIASMITMFSLIFAIMSMTYIYNIFLVGLVMFYIVVILFDLFSIGENQLKRFGKKPSIYVFIEDAAVVIKEGIINKLANLFK